MNKKILIILSVVLGGILLVGIQLSVVFIYMNNHQEQPKYSIKYPLEAVSLTEDADYVLVRTLHEGSDEEINEVVTDIEALRENKEVVRIISVVYANKHTATEYTNKLALYKNGKLISINYFDSLSEVAADERNGTLVCGTLDFQPVNKLQRDLMTGWYLDSQGDDYAVINTGLKLYLYSKGKTTQSWRIYAFEGDDTSPETKMIHVVERDTDYFKVTVVKEGDTLFFNYTGDSREEETKMVDLK